MKTLFLLLIASTAFARTISVDELKSRFMMSGETFIFDSTGKKLQSHGSEWRTWHNRNKSGKIEASWSSEVEGHPLVALHHVWQVKDDGTISGFIEQYGALAHQTRDEGPDFKNVIRKQDFELEDFAPVNWIAVQTKDYRIVVRLTPLLREELPVKPVTDLPISGTEIIVSDSKGNLWASKVALDSKYSGMITHRGAFFISYFPFPGAKELGTAQGRTIELNPEPDFYINIISRDSFLPDGISAKVYGRVDKKRTTQRLTSVRMLGSSNEEEFLKKVGG